MEFTVERNNAFRQTASEFSCALAANSTTAAMLSGLVCFVLIMRLSLTNALGCIVCFNTGYVLWWYHYGVSSTERQCIQPRFILAVEAYFTHSLEKILILIWFFIINDSYCLIPPTFLLIPKYSDSFPCVVSYRSIHLTLHAITPFAVIVNNFDTVKELSFIYLTLFEARWKKCFPRWLNNMKSGLSLNSSIDL